MYPQQSRVSLSEGISLHGLKYTSPKLRPFIIRRAVLDVVYNSDDISNVEAVNPKTSQLMTLTARLPTGLLAPITLKEWRSYKRRLNAVRQGARDRAKTPQQIAREVMEERQARIITERAASKKNARKTKSQEDSNDEYEDTTQTIEAAPIVFLDNPIRR